MNTLVVSFVLCATIVACSSSGCVEFCGARRDGVYPCRCTRDCRYYLSCRRGHTHVRRCRHGMLFDKNNNRCVKGLKNVDPVTHRSPPMSAAECMSLYEVIVLQEGYAFTTESGEDKADGSITLIKGPTNILVDTGGPCDREKLLKALHMHGLTPAEVDTVVGTHGHSDHIGNLNLFPHATVIVSHDISRGDTFISNHLGQGEPYKLHEWVEVLPTPGHTGSDVSVVVRNTRIGTVVVAGDLFECEDDLTDSAIWRDVSEQPEVQEKSRQRVLQIADYIVPGHGKMFHVSRPQDC